MIIRDRRIRFGVVGCGRIAEKHFEAIDAHQDDAQLVAVCDIDPTILRTAETRYDVPGFLRLRDMLADGGVDVAVLATPSGLHAEQAIETATAGVHVVSEKPMATRWRAANEMVETCDRCGVRLFVVKQNRYNSTLQLVKKAIDAGRFGRIYMVTLNVLWSRPQEYYDSAKWRGTWEFDGGAFMNQASHYIDLLDWLIGPVASVQAFTGTLARNIQVEDTGVANIRWRSGALGSVSVTMLAYPRNFEGSLTILGERGTARVGGVAVNTIEHWEFDSHEPGDEHVREASYETGSVYGFGHTRYYENVINTLRGTEEPLTDGREGLKSMELLIAIYQAARDARVVSLPLEY